VPIPIHAAAICQHLERAFRRPLACLLVIGLHRQFERGCPRQLIGDIEDGLVERLPSATDKRMVTLTLTNLGREMAAKIGALESQFYQANTDLVKDAPLPELLELLWRFVEGKAAGMALARRMGRETVDR
jgi:MarR family transcriptional regulator, organic hydroperoxide resistance regulator